MQADFFQISSKSHQADRILLQSSVLVTLMSTLVLIYKMCKFSLNLKHLHHALEVARLTQAKESSS